MGRFSLRSFDQILLDARDARSWFASIGIPTAGTRLELIESRTAELLEDLRSSSAEEVVRRWDSTDTYYALSDGIGFGKIAREIGKLGPNLLPKKALRATLEGPLSPRDETPGDASVNGRNFFTELELASDLSEKGIVPTGFDDLKFTFRDIDFHVQCKRLLSKSKARVKENITKAYAQLQGQMTNDHDRGIIALAIENVMAREGRILRVEDPSDLTQEVIRLVGEFRATFGHGWRDFVDPRVTGIMLILRFLCFSVRENVIGPAYYVALIDLATPGAFQKTNTQILRQLADHLGRGDGLVSSGDRRPPGSRRRFASNRRASSPW